MIPRFVVVPAIPKETGSMRSGSSFCCTIAAIGFNIYDNENKCRLQVNYSTRIEADEECKLLNAARLQSILAEHTCVS